jgi:hypothetical protein
MHWEMGAGFVSLASAERNDTGMWKKTVTKRDVSVVQAFTATELLARQTP